MYANPRPPHPDRSFADAVNKTILRIAVPSPLYRSFDYLPPAGTDPDILQPGIRVRVPFGRRRLVGVLLSWPGIALVVWSVAVGVAAGWW